MNAEAVSERPSTPGTGAPVEMLTPAQKAAIIITALPEDSSGELLKQLGEGHVRSFVKATHELRNVPQVLLERVILEFMETLDDRDLKFGPDAAKEILSRIMSADAVDNVIGDVTGVQRSVWDRLGGISNDDLSAYVTREHPRTSAIVLSRLDSEQAAEIIALLDVDTAERVIGLLKEISNVAPKILDSVGESVRVDLLEKSSKPVTPPDQIIGEIFDNLTDRTRDPLMKRLEDKTPDFAKAVAKRMFLFDDIPERVENRDVPNLTRVVDAAVLRDAMRRQILFLRICPAVSPNSWKKS